MLIAINCNDDNKGFFASYVEHLINIIDSSISVVHNGTSESFIEISSEIIRIRSRSYWSDLKFGSLQFCDSLITSMITLLGKEECEKKDKLIQYCRYFRHIEDLPRNNCYDVLIMTEKGEIIFIKEDKNEKKKKNMVDDIDFILKNTPKSKSYVILGINSEDDLPYVALIDFFAFYKSVPQAMVKEKESCYCVTTRDSNVLCFAPYHGDSVYSGAKAYPIHEKDLTGLEGEKNPDQVYNKSLLVDISVDTSEKFIEFIKQNFDNYQSYTIKEGNNYRFKKYIITVDDVTKKKILKLLKDSEWEELKDFFPQ